jgi:hypothetical protein
MLRLYGVNLSSNCEVKEGNFNLSEGWRVLEILMFKIIGKVKNIFKNM